MRNTHLLLSLLIVAIISPTASAQVAEEILHESLPEALHDTVIKVAPEIISPATQDSAAVAPAQRPLWRLERQQFMQSPDLDKWWLTFSDTTLTGLIERAVANNYNAKECRQRIIMARQVINQTRAGYFPTLAANASYIADQDAGAQVDGHTANDHDGYFSLGASLNWEVDLFGRIAAQTKADKASYEQAVANLDDALVSVCSNVAKAYFSLRMYQEEMKVALSHLDKQKELLKITETRFECGLVSKLDVVQARILVNSTLSTLPSLRAMIETSVNSIATLTASPRFELEYLLDETTLPSIPPVSPGDIPVEVLRRRPDVVAAEQQLAQSCALLGVSKKDFLPTLTVTGNIATEAHRFDGLFGRNAFTWAVTPTLSWTIFDGLARNYRTAEAKAQMMADVEAYNMTFHTAFQEAANAMINYRAAIDEAKLDSKVASDSAEAMSLALDRYRQGLSDFTNVVDAQMSYLEYRNSEIVSKGKALTSLATLYAALGGGY